MATNQTSYNPYINALIKTARFDKIALTYHFGTSASDRYVMNNNFVASFTTAQRQGFVTALQNYSSVCNLTFAQSDTNPDITPFEYNFGAGSSVIGQYSAGQLKISYVYPELTPGKMDFQNMMHEIGHWLGLRHPMEPASDLGGVIPADHAAKDYTVMIYGAALVGGDNSYSTYLQTLGIDDIRAVQYMYGANFGTNSTDSTYTWDKVTGQELVNGIGQGTPYSPCIFSSLWDGGGNDTYDLSNFTTNLNIDLQPGHWSSFGALLPNADRPASIPGNVANAYLYVDQTTGVADTRSLIENAIGGSGDDYLIGNQANNKLTGNAGNDTLDGGLGADTLDGGAGNDTYYVDTPDDLIIEQSQTGGVDTVVSTFTYSLTTVNSINGSYLENLTLAGSENLDGTGTDSANILTGNAGNNYLYGLAGDDTLDGGLGADTMDGGAGNDTYYVDNPNDVIIEQSQTGGVDTVVSTFTYSLAAANSSNGSFLENLILAGVANLDGTGTDAANTLTGNAGNNHLYGLGGNDTLDGGAGDDTLQGGAGDDVYKFGFGYGTDTIVLGVRAPANVLQTDGGNDVLLLNAGIRTADINWTREGDDLVGALIGTSDKVIIRDYYLAPSSPLTVKLSDGTVVPPINSHQTGTDYAESLTASRTSIWIDGKGGNDTISGSSGNDTIDGGAGADNMSGGTGSDTYYVDDPRDLVTESASYVELDTIIASINYTLPANVEKLVLAGSADLTATGNSAANTIIGNDGRNVIDGGGGNDTMSGGKGDDTYYVYTSFDTVIENQNEGTDTVIAKRDGYTLGANLENLTLAEGSTYLVGTGNALDNVINGNSYNNTLKGDLGNDLIYGNGGDDTIYGNGGDDTLDGGAGNDTLYGGYGHNTYWFGFGDGRDVINVFATATAATDSLVLKAGVTKQDVTLSYEAGTGYLILSLNRGEKITIKEFDNSGLTPAQAFSNLTITLNDGMIVDIPINALNTTNKKIGTNNPETISADAVGQIIYGYGGNDSLKGTYGSDTLDGGAGDDTLDGTMAVDKPNTLIGGTGDDTYNILVAASNGFADYIIEKPGEGYDTVTSVVSFSIAYAPNVEKLSITGSATYAGGNDGDNLIIGNANINTIDGAGGADTMQGGAGDDTYYVDNVGDVVDEAVGEGADTVVSWLHDYSLADIGVNLRAHTSSLFTVANTTYADTVENLTLVETAVNGTGNSLDNVIKGDGLDNKLSGLGGNDTINGLGGNDMLDGGVGNDTLDGGIGDDTLDGGVGRDQLFGGDGNDVVFYDAADDLANVQGGAGIDTLVFTSGTAPTSFNLATQGFEGAEGRFVDTGANPWTTKTQFYNINWRLTKEVLNNDDGTITTTRYDPTVDDDWSQMSVHTDLRGNMDFVRYLYNDGTSTETTYDTGSIPQTWSSILVSKDARSNIDYQTTNYRDGTTQMIDYDQNNTFDWTQILSHTDSAHNMDRATVSYDDHSGVDTQFDWTIANPWSSISTFTNTVGRTDHKMTVNDDRSMDDVDFNLDASFNWSQNQIHYDALGRVASSVTINNDNSRTTITHDANNDFTWDSVTTAKDGLNRVTSLIYTYDDGHVDMTINTYVGAGTNPSSVNHTIYNADGTLL